MTTSPTAARRPAPALLLTLVVAAVTAAALFVIAFSGGSYDLVDRQTAAIIIWWAVGLGALIVSPGPRRPGTAGLLVTLFAALIAVWIAVNLGHSISKERTVTELARAVTHLGPIVLIGWVLPAKCWKGVFAGLLIAAVAILAASFGSRLHPGFLGQQQSIVFQNTASRLAFPLGYWNAIGSWSVMTTVLLLATSAHATRAAYRGLALAFVPLAITVGYMTYSRSSIGAMALGLLVVWALSKNRWTITAHGVIGGLGAGAGVLAVHGAPAIADATGTDGGGTVLVTVVIAGIVVGLVAAVTGRVGLDNVRVPGRAGRLVLSGVAVAGIVLAVILGSALGPKAWHQFENTASNDGAAPTQRLSNLQGTRIAQWRIALDAYRANKLHGTGAGTFELENNLNTKNGEFVRDDHNAFLEALGEQGWPGLVVLVGMLLSIVGAIAVALRRARDAVDRGLVAGAAAALAAFVLGTGVDWFWEVTGLALFALGLAATVIAAGDASRRPKHQPRLETEAMRSVDSEERPGISEATDPPTKTRDSTGARPARPRRTFPSWPLRVALVAAAIVAVLVELPGLVGTSEIRRSGRDVAAGDLVAARSHADQAIDTMPWASSPFLQRALVDEQAGAWDSSLTALRYAIQRDPYDWRLPLVQARVEAKAGHAKAALVAYRKAKSLRPTGAFFR